MEVERTLPSVHLDVETIAEFEELLSAGSTDPRLEISLDYGAVSFQSLSSTELRRNATLPGVVRSFEIVAGMPDGQVELESAAGESELSVRIQGEDDWVREHLAAVESFFETHGGKLRTVLERYLAVGLTIGTVLSSLLLYASGFGSAVGMRVPIDALLYGSLALMAGGVLHLLLNAVYPYALIVPDRRLHSTPVYVRV